MAERLFTVHVGAVTSVHRAMKPSEALVRAITDSAENIDSAVTRRGYASFSVEIREESDGR